MSLIFKCRVPLYRLHIKIAKVGKFHSGVNFFAHASTPNDLKMDFLITENVHVIEHEQQLLTENTKSAWDPKGS